MQQFVLLQTMDGYLEIEQIPCPTDPVTPMIATLFLSIILVNDRFQLIIVIQITKDTISPVPILLCENKG